MSVSSRRPQLSNVKLRQFAVEELELRSQVLAQSLARAWEVFATMSGSERAQLQAAIDALQQEVKHVGDDLTAARQALLDAKHTEQWGPVGSELFNVQLAIQSPRLARDRAPATQPVQIVQTAPFVPTARSLPHVPLDPVAQRAMQVHQRGDDTRQLRDFTVLQQFEPFKVRRDAGAVPFGKVLQQATPTKFEHARVEMGVLEEAVNVSQRYLAHGEAAFQSPEAFNLQKAQHQRLQQALRASRVVVRESMALLNMPLPGGPAASAGADAEFDFRDVCNELGIDDEEQAGYGVLPSAPKNVKLAASMPALQLPSIGVSPARPTSPGRPMSPGRTAPALTQSTPTPAVHGKLPTSPFKQHHQALPKVVASELPDVPLSPRAALAQTSPMRAALPVSPRAPARPHAATEAPAAEFKASNEFRAARMSVGPKAATLFKVVAEWEYDNQGNHRKLSFAKDEVLDVVSLVGDQWLHCVNAHGFEGLVPVNRVRKL